MADFTLTDEPNGWIRVTIARARRTRSFLLSHDEAAILGYLLIKHLPDVETSQVPAP